MQKVAKHKADGQKTGESSLEVTFWGVRGTLPSPGTQFVEFGGNTSCVEVSTLHPESQFERSCSLVFDAGTGIVPYGDSMLARGARQFHILLSHYHYDHIIGLTRFAPLFRTDIQIHFYGQTKGGLDIRSVIEKLFSFPFFPVEYRQLPSRKNMCFHEVIAGTPLEVGSMIVTAHHLNHPQQSLAYRVWDKNLNVSAVYATDHEHGTDADNSLVGFSKDAHLLLLDTTYTDEIYCQGRIGWGHSTARRGAELAGLANVGSFGLFHHDPDASDDFLKNRLLPEALACFPGSFLCKEGDSVRLSSELSEKNLPLVLGGATPIRRTLVSKRRKISG